MPFPPGTRLAHYVVEHPLGAGGMGEVYAAHDTRLNRRVAIKVLSAAASTAEIHRALQREAQTIAALNHPHIVTLYSIEQDGPTTFMTMEIVEGMSLSKAIDGKPMPIDRMLVIATELADAVAAAHDKGVIHRDIKPGNVMITPELRTKVLDFGIAKAFGRDQGADDATVTQSMAGAIVGSAPYMSPEQARGDSVDHRTDIFSMGATLFEMLSGRRPFEGRTSADLSAAILTTPVVFPKPDSPRHGELQRVIERCLEKNPDDRYQTARDLASDLRRLARHQAEAASAPAPRPWLKVAAVAGVGAVIGLAAAGWTRWNAGDEAAGLVLENPRQLTFAQGAELDPSWSPDGSRIAYHAGTDLWVSQIGGASTNLSNSRDARERMPVWSPDGTQIAFVSSADGGGLFVMPAVGGKERRVIAVSSRGSFTARPAWSADSKRLALPMYNESQRKAALHVVELETQAVSLHPLSGEEPSTGQDLAWSPDGRFIAYIDATIPLPEVSTLYLHRLGENEGTKITNGRSIARTPQFSGDGRTLYYVSNHGGSSDLWSQPLAAEGTIAGEPTRLTTGVGMSSASFSTNGALLAYARGREQLSNIWRLKLPNGSAGPASWRDATQLTFDDALIEFLDVSDDGQWIYLSSDRRGNQDIWRMPSSGGELTQVTFDPAPDWRPTLSPDGKHVAFYSFRAGQRHLWRAPVDGGEAQQLTTRGAAYHPTWSRDGSRIAFSIVDAGVRRLATIASTGGEVSNYGEPGDNYPAWSRDGRIAFRRIASSRSQFLVSDLQGNDRAYPFSIGLRVGRPVWSEDGKFLLFPSDQKVLSLDFSTGALRPLADFSGKPGIVGDFSLSLKGDYLYFAWQTPTADIWVMDAVRR